MQSVCDLITNEINTQYLQEKWSWWAIKYNRTMFFFTLRRLYCPRNLLAVKVWRDSDSKLTV